MNFKPLFLLLVFSVHANTSCLYEAGVGLHSDIFKQGTSSLTRAILDSDPAALRLLLKKGPSQKELKIMLQAAQNVTKYRLQDLNNFGQEKAKSNTPKIILPKSYADKVGDREAAAVCLLGGLLSFFVVPLSIMEAKEYLKDIQENKYLTYNLAMTSFTSAISLFTGLMLLVGLAESHRCEKKGLNPYKAVCHQYLEDMYKRSLEVEMLISERLD